MTLLLLFCVTFTFTIATQNKTAAIINDILEVIQLISEDKYVIIPPMELPSRGTKGTSILFYDNYIDHEESETDIEHDSFEDLKYFNEQNDKQSPKYNLLRWLPKKKKLNGANKAEAISRDKAIKLRDEQHAERVAFVVSVIKHNYQTALYLYEEVKRIQKNKQLIDNTRGIILHLESLSPEIQIKLRPRVRSCFMKAKENDNKTHVKLWHKPNE